MAKKNKIRVPRTHNIMNKPILALFLMPAWCLIITSIFGDAIDEVIRHYSAEYTSGIGYAVIGLICLGIHKGWFKGEFDGNLRLRNFGKGMLLLLPVLLFVVTNLMGVEDLSNLTGKRVLLAFFCGLGPGVLEEVAFRGLAGSNFMRVWRDGKRIFPVALMTSLIFGATHLANIFSGAGIAITITQAVYSFGLGVIFSAVFFRTGSLLPTVIAHTLIDFTAFLQAEVSEAGGVLTDSGFDPTMIWMGLIGLVLVGLGYFYLRPTRREEILALWAEKWKQPEEELPAEA